MNLQTRVTAGVAILVMGVTAGCDMSSPRATPSVAGTQPTDLTGVAAQATADAAIARLRQEVEALKKAAATQPTPAKARTPPGTPPSSTRHAIGARPPRTATPTGSSTDTASFAALARRLGGSVGVAYAPLGVARPATSFGALTTGVGWSTMKVPLAIAVVKQANGHPPPNTFALMRRAITESDNSAAMALWSRLGAGTTAATRTQAVLGAGGDSSTVVPANAQRPGYTPFGQSEWSLAAQATFAASLPCIANSGPVLTLMGQVTPSQRWGIGAVSNTVAFKGGWGPGADGHYVVRQLGIVRLDDGTRIGLAVAALPRDGQFQTGIDNVDALASWAVQHIRAGGSSGC